MKRHKMSARWLSAFIIALLVFPGICLAADTITINGSGSALDMMKPMIAAYQKNNKGVAIKAGVLVSSGAAAH